MGFPFKQGDIPSGQFVATSLATAQATVKNVWPDGSVKFAIIAGRAALGAGVPSTVTLSATTTAPTGTALALADLVATGITAAVGAGSFGSVSWSGTDWNSPFQSWVAGPQMSSWIYRKPVGSDAHLVAWLEVRLYAGGNVEVLPWIENGYLRVASPATKTATFTFSLGSTQRFSASIALDPHCRTPLISGSALSYWLGTDPGVTPKHDAAYLQSTRMVPTYRATVSPTATIVSDLPASFAPLQLGSYESQMGSTGYSRSIGLLPEWDMLYLTTTAQSVWAALQRNGYSAGRWMTHYRDETTNRPLRFSQCASLGMSYTGWGTFPPGPEALSGGWDMAHQPAMGYFAYLVTGRWYFMEEVQFNATHNFLWQPPDARGGASGIINSSSSINQLRGAAWNIRTLANAVAVTPDADTALRGEFIASFEANVTRYHTRYIAQSNYPLGFVEELTTNENTAGNNYHWFRPWMYDFWSAVHGYARAHDLPISATAKSQLALLHNYYAQTVVGRLGGTSDTEWLFCDAALYDGVVNTTRSPNWTNGTGPWATSFGQLYNATFGTLGSPGARAAGPLRGGNFPGEGSYWGNLQPAIAYAVDFGVPGAQAAYNRMISASNWGQLVTAFNTLPVWSVQPR